MSVTDKLLDIKDIHQLVEQLSAYLQKAIIIENKNFELIAYSAPSGFSFDPVQQKTILTKRCPLYVIEWLKKEGVVERLEKNNHPIRLHRMEDIDFYERVVISLKYEGRLYGYLWIYEAAMLEDKDLGFLEDIAPHLGKSLYKKQYVEESDQQTFIWKMLNHEYISDVEMFQEAKRVSFGMPTPCTVIVYSVRDVQLVYVLEKIKAYFNRVGITYYLGKGTEIIGLVSSDMHSNEGDATDFLLKEIRELLTEEEYAAVFVGVGNMYDTLPSLRKSYLEALEVIETLVFLNVAKQETFHFQHLGMYRYMKLMYKKNMNDKHLNRHILKLMQADIKNNSELLWTLWHYLKHDCKVNKTAEALFIHPNTMSYRLKQMEELIRIDFSNMEAKVEYYMQLMLIHYVPDYRAFYEQELDNSPILEN